MCKINAKFHLLKLDIRIIRFFSIIPVLNGGVDDLRMLSAAFEVTHH